MNKDTEKDTEIDNINIEVATGTPDWVLKYKQCQTNDILDSLSQKTFTRMEILEGVFRYQPAAINTIEKRINKDNANLSRYLKQLKGSGLVSRQKNQPGKTTRWEYKITEKGHEWLKWFLNVWEKRQLFEKQVVELNQIVDKGYEGGDTR